MLRGHDRAWVHIRALPACSRYSKAAPGMARGATAKGNGLLPEAYMLDVQREERGRRYSRVTHSGFLGFHLPLAHFAVLLPMLRPYPCRQVTLMRAPAE